MTRLVAVLWTVAPCTLCVWSQKTKTYSTLDFIAELVFGASYSRHCSAATVQACGADKGFITSC
jgi:hypothetical protein